MGWKIWGLNPGRAKRFCLLHSVQTISGAYRAFCSMNTGFLPRVKQSECDVDSLSLSSTMVENE